MYLPELYNKTASSLSACCDRLCHAQPNLFADSQISLRALHKRGPAPTYYSTSMTDSRIGPAPPFPFSVDPMMDPTAGLLGVEHARIRAVIVLEFGPVKGSRAKKTSEYLAGTDV